MTNRNKKHIYLLIYLFQLVKILYALITQYKEEQSTLSCIVTYHKKSHICMLIKISSFQILAKISKTPTVVDNQDFDNELQRVRNEIARLVEEAQNELGQGPVPNITDNLNELSGRLDDIRYTLLLF